MHVGSGARRDVAHSATEDAVHPDNHIVTGAHHVHERRFHARRTGCAHRERELVGGTEHAAQALVRLVEQGDELGVEMAEHRPGEGGHDLGIGIAGAGAHEDAVGEWHTSAMVSSRAQPRCGGRPNATVSRAACS